jgi:hypothetical protein
VDKDNFIFDDTKMLALEPIEFEPIDMEGESIEVVRGGPGSGHHGHKGRPGEVGGSTPSGEGVLSYATPHTPAEEVMFDHQANWNRMREASLPDKFGDWAYHSYGDFVEKNGRWYLPPETAELPEGIEAGEPRMCFYNALMCIMAQANDDLGLTYVEGFGATGVVEWGTPHAWLVDKGGRVYDPTWGDKGTAYWGVAFDRDFVLNTILEKGTTGIIPQSMENINLLQDGFPEDAVVFRGKHEK